MIKTKMNLIPDTINPTPDYYCTWQTQLYATSDGKVEEQRKSICEDALFNAVKPYGWAHFYEEARKDLFFVMDDSWDVPFNNDPNYYGSLVLSEDKFPSYAKDRDNGLKLLAEKVKSLGWKGLGGWVCAQESPIYSHGKTVEEYWIERLKAMNQAGISYWKVDWGSKSDSLGFRKMLTELARIYAPNLIVEQAIVKDIFPDCDAFRTYDVPAIMSIPMTMEKLAAFGSIAEAIGRNKGLINCEDEAYMAAAGGYAMGIMRHPYAGKFTDGKDDMSFPEIHRNLKSKMYEVVRAARWHRIAPAFSGGNFNVAKTTLADSWKFENKEAEIEEWWLSNPLVADYLNDGVLVKAAPSAISRSTDLPNVSPDKNGNIPFSIASLNPTGVFSIATLGRTIGRDYHIPECDVTAKIETADTIGIFGKYKTLTLETDADYRAVFMQDIADNAAFDITEYVKREQGRLIIPGALIYKVGTAIQPDNDTSEPGAVLKLIR